MESKTQHERGITRRKNTQYNRFCPKEERNASLKKVSSILQKAEHERTLDDEQILGQYSELVAALKLRRQRRDEAKRRLEEFEEPASVLEEKCEMLARAIASSEHLVVYTGAGISTAARIPDYRGSNGIWTRLQQGKDIGSHDLSQAEPTFTHMALSQLYRQRVLKYVVSQNCDGLHLRSGLPRGALSELHGNMYVEVCKNCKPAREYWRLFDVTENTARYSHRTMRRCYACSHELVDSIVHFGERGSLQWPLNWAGACQNADAADTIVCLGSSLKVLKRYPWLWQMSKPAKKRPALYIVNLQWTPKDDCAALKINGKCDAVMRLVMKCLGVAVPAYARDKDPIFAHASSLCAPEAHTTSQPPLEPPPPPPPVPSPPPPEQRQPYDLSVASASGRRRPAHCLPANAFSIDSILRAAEAPPPALLPGDMQALLAYYELANSVLHSQMLGYLSGCVYPHQTSFLYPGLHSILNPVPYLSYDFESMVGGAAGPAPPGPTGPHCAFCSDTFGSASCLYYARADAVFAKQLQRFSKSQNCSKPLVCVCCDYTTDEDSDGDDKAKKKPRRPAKGDDGDKSDGASENIDETNINKAKVQPGWFGKGCRKNRRPKKK